MRITYPFAQANDQMHIGDAFKRNDSIQIQNNQFIYELLIQTLITSTTQYLNVITNKPQVYISKERFNIGYCEKTIFDKIIKKPYYKCFLFDQDLKNRYFRIQSYDLILSKAVNISSKLNIKEEFIIIYQSENIMSQLKEPIQNITKEQFQIRFGLIGKIDSGTYGIVEKYLDRQKGQQVALKFLKGFEGLDGFKKQVKIMTSVNHENVLKCYGFYYIENKNQYFLSTPFCEKKSLKDNLYQISRSSEENKIWICLQIGRGLQALHKKNIMHRDIKPANILIDHKQVIKICDFGFGRQDSHDLSKSIKVGTPTYRDPNIQSGKYTKKCDIYSLGLVYDTIFRGSSYFKSSTQQRFRIELVNLRQNKRKIINQLNCPSDMKQLIVLCLENNESKRPNIENVVAKLQEIYKNYRTQNSKFQFFQNQTQDVEENCTTKSLIIPQLDKITKKKRSNSLLQEPELLPDPKLTEQQPQPKQSQIDKLPQIKYTESRIQIRIDNNSSQKQEKKQRQNKRKREIKPRKQEKKEHFSYKDQLFFKKLIQAQKQEDQNQKSSQNFLTIYARFAKNKKEILGLQKTVNSTELKSKKLLNFIIIFAYIRRLKIQHGFFNGDLSIIKEVAGIKYQELTKFIKQRMGQIILEEITVIERALNQLSKKFQQSQPQFRNLNPEIKSMISSVRMKNLEGVTTEFNKQQLIEQCRNLLHHERYGMDDKQEKTILLSIQQFF